jgi:cyclase
VWWSGRARPKQRGAGEILLTSMDADGTRAGFDCELTAAVSEAVGIPVIASGGAGTVAHFADVFGRGKARCGAGGEHFSLWRFDARSLKEELAQAGVPVRLPC